MALQGSASWDLQCCTITRFTAAADSANWDSARAELFLWTRRSCLVTLWEVRVSYFLILAGVSSGHQSWDSVLRKGCSSTSRALSLSFAVFTSSLEMRSFAESEIFCQTWGAKS